MGIALVAALQDGATRRMELPSPLPDPPPIPYEYLMRLSTRIDSPVLQHADQLAIVGQLRESLEIEEDDEVRADLGALMHRLRSRSDVTFRAASEIDALLRQYDSTAPVAQPTPAPHPPPGAPTVRPGWPSHQMPPAADRPQQTQGDEPPPRVPPVTASPAQPASQRLAILGIVLGAVGVLPAFGLFIGIAGIVCASMAKARNEPLANAALTTSILATVLGLLIWASLI